MVSTIVPVINARPKHMKAKPRAISMKSKSLNILHRIRHNRVISLAVLAFNNNDWHDAIDQVNR
jgi:hypothetical protein